MHRRDTFSLRAPARVRAASRDVAPQPGGGAADWLQEAAKRTWETGSPPALRAVVAEPRATLRVHGTRWYHIQSGRDLAGLTVLTLGWLQYHFLDAMVHINNLPKVIVFVPLGVT